VTTARRIHERTLLDALEALPAERFEGAVWRTTFASRDPLAGNFAGGRWDPPGEFEVLYTSLEADGSLAEAYFHLSRAPVFTSATVLLTRIRVVADRVLKLADQKLLQLFGIEDPLASQLDYSKSQAIGAAAHFLEFQGMLVPSARWPCQNFVLFLDRLDLNRALAAEEQRDINWPAWRTKVAALSNSSTPDNLRRTKR
jgi:RES domain-containing protein